MNAAPNARLRRANALSVLALAGLLAVALSACAPEPDEIAGAPEKGTPAPEATSWTEPETEFDPNVKSTDLPDGFPSEAFPVPDGATVDDAGARSEFEWFVVFSAADGEAADALWNQIIDDGDFSVDDESRNDDGGRSALLINAELTVSATTIPDTDGSVLLSYDLSSADDSAE
ncbi:hypothetical protein GCM10009847_25350 [Leucobacter tardus]|uniref:Lipoprotein n=1 Tax=Leucobacter tardus TaxID=501483 RepID=A0A939QDS5_9MICO|nr:hypothetical protein [Leucobacter tardus]MBO2989956.1 hypothetical protein [Leucobacter tardus]